MSTLSAAQIDDLVKTTLPDLGKLKFTNIATTLQEYEVMSRILKKDRVGFDSGKSIQTNLMVQHGSQARMVGLYQADNYTQGDVMQTVDIPWRHTHSYYMYDIKEIKMNRGASKIVDLLTTRRISGMLALAKLMEDQFWSKPIDSTDTKNLFGLFYWLVRNATEGFNGGAPSGFTAGAAGLVHPRWANYTGQYTTVSKTNLIAMMRRARRKTFFKAPVDIPDYRGGKGQRFRIYTNESVVGEMEQLLESQNDNLGTDLFRFDGATTFGRTGINWVPKLDEDTTNPVIMLDMETIYPVFLSGEYLREEGPDKAPNQHNVRKIDIDLTWNILCRDRRPNTIFYK
jgi:hypothetical protein